MSVVNKSSEAIVQPPLFPGSVPPEVTPPRETAPPSEPEAKPAPQAKVEPRQTYITKRQPYIIPELLPKRWAPRNFDEPLHEPKIREVKS